MQETQPKKKSTNTWVIVVILLLAILAACCICATAGAIIVARTAQTVDLDADLDFLNNIGVQNVPFPTENFAPPSEDAFAMFDRLSKVIVPENNYYELGEMFLGEYDVPRSIPAKEYQVGDIENFWVTNNDTDEQFQITAVLRAASPHVYFWIDDEVSYNEDELTQLVDTFENDIYPTNQAFFGTEWSPGIDNDPHLYLVYARGLGSNVAGYFSSIDSIPPQLQEFSNAHETFMINADAVSLGESYTYSVLAHEHQHMIHWNLDRNETTWINEGFSELATVLSGYSPGGADFVYLSNPDIQLNTWPTDPNARYVHYGSSYLFMQYFLDRFGASATQALVKEPANGFESVDRVLESLGQPYTAEGVFIDWTLANFLNDSTLEDGFWAYDEYSPSTVFGLGTTDIDCADGDWSETTVAQFGVDQINPTCQTGDVTLRFEGIGEVGILPEDPAEGKNAFWSNYGDESEMSLTRQFDLSQVSGSASLDFKLWYDLEVSYDYAYVLLSADGEHWEMARTAYTTSDDPVGSNYGWGYNGLTEIWVNESVDLSDYTGGNVWVRFTYVTDAAVNGDGLMIDDMHLDAIGYATGFEEDDGGWDAQGFVRIENRLAQRFSVTIVKKSAFDTEVEIHTFYGGETLDLPVTDLNDWDTVTVLVSGLTRYTIQPANYRLQLIAED